MKLISKILVVLALLHCSIGADAQNETEQKKRIGLLFDLNKMKNERFELSCCR